MFPKASVSPTSMSPHECSQCLLWQSALLSRQSLQTPHFRKIISIKSQYYYLPQGLQHCIFSPPTLRTGSQGHTG